jgi:probable F420-dependent oxidoreductase
VLVAKDVASLDLLSDGRLELGIGAGRPDAETDNRMLGKPFDSGSVRVARLAEALALLKQLLSGQTVTTSGDHYRVEAAEVSPRGVQQPRPPILVAGGGRQMLSLAAREADIVALALPQTANERTVAEKIGWLREAAGPRFDQLELNMNLMAVGDQVPRYVATQMGITARDLANAGAVSAIVGGVDEMCSTLVERRERFGISYFLVGDELMETFAPVVERLSGR